MASGAELLWQVLIEFVLRLSLGVAIAMGVTGSRDVTSGFFRVHLWVLLGLNTLAVLAIWTSRAGGVELLGALRWSLVMSGALAGAVLSYVGSVAWLYEAARGGKVLVWAVAGVSGLGAMAAARWNEAGQWGLSAADVGTGSLLLGSVVTAMLLGHWYLNTPTMRLGPLRRLLVLLMLAVALRAAVAAWGWQLAPESVTAAAGFGPFLALRWLAGIAAAAVLAALAWQTLKVPNTQSATGILYAAVIVVLIGELTSQLLSAELPYAL